MSVPPFSRLPRRWRAVVLPLSTLAVLVVILTIRRETPPSSPPTSGGSASPTAAVKPKPTRQATAIAVPSAIADAASEGGRPDSRSEAVSRAPRSPGWQRPEFGSDWGAERHPALRAFSAWVERRRENGVWSGLAEGARLEIVELPGQAWCMQCAKTVRVQQRFHACPDCGGRQLQVTGGEEMRIKELEVD